MVANGDNNQVQSNQVQRERMLQIFRDDSMHRLLGICSGIIADGTIHRTELDFLQTWLTANKAITNHWPANVIAQKVDQVVQDGQVTQDELDGLLIALKTITGTAFIDTGSSAPESVVIPSPKSKKPKEKETRLILSGDLPPMPEIQVEFKDKVFCFSGNFLFGPKKTCEMAVEKHGGTSVADIKKSVDYLVVGSIPNSAWKFGSYGRKIEAAAKWHAEEGTPHILSEENWQNALDKM